MELMWNGKPKKENILMPTSFYLIAKEAENSYLFGDNAEIMRAMLGYWKGKIDLIYFDPPFATGKRFHSREKKEAYKDQWKNLEEYLSFIYERIVLMYRLLADTGSIYVHIDYRTDGYIRLIMDEIFGYDKLRNIVYWHYGLGGSSNKKWQQKTDTILFYTKSNKWYFNPLMVPATSNKMKGKKKKMDNVWEIPALNNMAKERTGYPTQKPLKLLERIIIASSRENDIVMDPFAGSGTTLIAAQNLGRRFIGIDKSEEAQKKYKDRLKK